MRVTAVVVNYNTRDLLLENLRGLVVAREAGALQEIIVVDCASSDGSANAARGLPGVAVIDAPNRGFGAGANVGMQSALDRAGSASGGPLPDALLILNADAHMQTYDIRALTGALAAHADTGIIGPLLRYPDGMLQPSLRRFPTRFTPLFESTPLALRWPTNRWRNAYLSLDRSGDISKLMNQTTQYDEHEGEGCASDAPPPTIVTDWVVGAALLIRREALLAVGGFDERFDMFSEEVDLAWRLRERGWLTRWTPAATSIHVEGASTTQDVPRRQAQFDTSRVRLTRDRFGRPTAELVRAGLLLGYVWNLAFEGGKYLLGHRRDLRRARLRVYSAALCTGLRDREPRRTPITPVSLPTAARP